MIDHDQQAITYADAQQSIDTLREAYARLTEASAVQAAHLATRTPIELDAVQALCNSVNPLTQKPWSYTAAMENTDLVPTMKEWRRRRTELEQQVYCLMADVEVAKRQADLCIAMARSAT